ncbi:MAG: 4-(cytidine 5'-diphospho)-2-C-methyl-D-erythritol kinase [Ferrovibrio sp.]|uniref:4-(cytidine 5'-diphospho)-2-C-methyl-D-erythritol kinase n=1 Tax=Ferrovibrio sp. TaxID=1917215 RepID=UPI0026347E09|nr:4-(cytidine 5'-diphospho)-2-C-methyl-D-erythritol kinase [Ferrovibrio sp.]MCW0234825.1 4-(cytidine 5'-diphospho)-2-C-methyl-D-erythritol kinase [Ferrovibrio sp.]
MTAAGLSRLAPAKINLFLHVTGRRPAHAAQAGYHELESLVVFAQDPAACDRIAVAPADDLTLVLAGPQAAALPPDSDSNLVLRAARQLQTMNGRAMREAGAAITLTKTLPVASGIGGGSADAAATLHALRALWQIEVDDEALARAALPLGADIPACLLGRAALMTGIGEELCALPPLPPFWLVLANPGVALATKDVFSALNAGLGTGRFGMPMPLERRPDSAADLAILLRARRNDLEAPARFLAPEIDPVLAAVKAQAGCLLARLSGSGATCFGLFAEKRDADFAARNLARAYPKWWVAATAAG